MSERIYRFEPFDGKLWQGNPGEILWAWDPFHQTKVCLYGWNVPADQQFDRLKDAYARLQGTLGPTVEQFTHAKRLYFAAPDLQTAQTAMEKLQAEALFVGLPIWKNSPKPEVTPPPVEEPSVISPTLTADSPDMTQATSNDEPPKLESIGSPRDFTRSRLIHGVALVLILGGVAVAAWKYLSQPTVLPATGVKNKETALRVGLYAWPHNLPGFMAATDSVTTKWKPSLKQNFRSFDEYDVVVVPLSLVFEVSQSLLANSKWRLVWLPEQSAEGIVMLKRIALKEDAIPSHRMAYVSFDYGRARIGDYLFRNYGEKAHQMLEDHQKTFDSARELYEAVAAKPNLYSLVVVDEPYLGTLQREGKFEIFDKRDKPISLTVILASRDVLNDPKKLTDLKAFVKRWDVERSDHPTTEHVWFDDPKITTDDSLSAVQSSHQAYSVLENFRFLYNTKGSCKKAASMYYIATTVKNEPSSSDACDLTDDTVLLSSSMPVSLELSELEELCKNPKASEDKAEISIPKFRPKDDTIPDGVRTDDWRLDTQQFYCVIGHGDHTGDDKYNRDLSFRRANKVAVKIDPEKGHPKLIAVSAGYDGAPYYGPADNFRRVDVKRLRFQSIKRIEPEQPK